MKEELQKHLPPLICIFLLISIFWVIAGVSNIDIIFLFSGLILGSFFLDLDHLIFWFYLKPNLEESKLVQIAFKQKDFKAVLVLLQATRKTHNNLIFHHYFFQSVLVLISIFVFTSSTNIFTKAFLLSLNLHLLVDEIHDYLNDKLLLQNWLFAREQKQLPLKYLTHYLFIFSILVFTFVVLLLKSKL